MVLAAAGMDWRRLDLEGLDELLGHGVYYGGGPERGESVCGRARRPDRARDRRVHLHRRRARTRTGAPAERVVTDAAGYILTGQDLVDEPARALRAAGRVRHGSTKRLARAVGEGAMAAALAFRRLAELGVTV